MAPDLRDGVRRVGDLEIVDLSLPCSGRFGAREIYVRGRNAIRQTERPVEHAGRLRRCWPEEISEYRADGAEAGNARDQWTQSDPLIAGEIDPDRHRGNQQP